MEQEYKFDTNTFSISEPQRLHKDLKVGDYIKHTMVVEEGLFLRLTIRRPRPAEAAKFDCKIDVDYGTYAYGLRFHFFKMMMTTFGCFVDEVTWYYPTLGKVGLSGEQPLEYHMEIVELSDHDAIEMSLLYP